MILRRIIKIALAIYVVRVLLLANRAISEDGEEGLDLFDLATLKGFVIQRSDFHTSSGYNLNVFRLQWPQNGAHFFNNSLPRVLLLHGLGGDMNMFIGNYENNVLPFYLARNGYDVYLSNFRGTSYTLDHLKLSHRDANFWEFSFHEMAHEDLPAIFDHITNITHDSNNNSTRNKINVVPLSMGGGILLLSLAARIPSVVNNVGKILLISPIMFMKNDQNLLLQFLNVTNIVQIFKYLGLNHYRDHSLNLLAKYFPQLFRYLMSYTFDGALSPVNAERFHYMMHFYPSGTSMLTFAHGVQIMKSGELKQYDYGSDEENRKHYNGSSRPPAYDLSQIRESIVLYVGQHDPVINDVEINAIVDQLKNAHLVEVRYRKHGHMSFLHSNDTAFYAEILKDLQKVD